MIVISSNDTVNLKKLSGLIWVYIGSYKGQERAKSILKESKRRFIAEDIGYVADSVRDNFIDYIGRLSTQQSDKVLWYSSPIASKSICQTSTFNQYVYQKLLNRLKELENKDILVVTDNNELLENIRKIQPEKIRILSKDNSCKNKIRKIYKKIRGYGEIFKHIFFWLICRFMKNKQLRDFNIFIHSWIDERTFQNLPIFTDPYFADLSGFLAERGYHVGRLTPLRVDLKYIFRLGKYFRNIIYPLSYLTFNDLVKGIFTRFTITMNNDNLADIEDIKILSTLAENGISKENISRNYLHYLLLFYSYKSLSFKINNNISLIYPFENQPWEKMLNLAFASFNRIAYQHTTIPYNWLDYRVSRYEKELPLPNVILSTGKKWASFLKSYYNNLTIEDAGALRFSYLFDKKQKEEGDSQRKDIIVALSISPAISIPLQRQLLKFLRRNPLADYTIKIKPHPYLPKYAHLESAFAGYKNCRFVRQNISQLLKNCVLFVAYESSILLEPILSGIKTLCFIPEELSFGFEHFIRDDLFIAYEKDFSDKLEEALKSPDYPKVDIEEYFSPPNYTTFLEHINANERQN